MGKIKQNVFWSKQDLELVRKNYSLPNGLTLLQSLLPARSYNQIKAQAYWMGLRRKPLYFKNEAFFSQMSPTVASIAGFIAADGYIDKANKRFTICLSDKDSAHLEFIKKTVEYTGPIYHRKPKEKQIIDKDSGKSYTLGKGRIAVLMIGKASKWMDDLDKLWNIRTQKTFNLLPPPIRNLKLVMSYISGLIDGDGWICFGKDGTPGLSVMGTKELMTWVKQVFDHLTPGYTKSNLYSTSSQNIYVYSIHGVRAYLIWKLFMALDIHRLTRKWSKFEPYHQAVMQDGLSKWGNASVLRCQMSPTLTEDMLGDKIVLEF